MQLLLGLRDSWKCIEVGLEDGCTPCIGGKAVSDCNIEPAQWFKVLVLDSVCVDCSQRMITWSVANSLSESDMNSSISTVITQQLRRRITLNGSTHLENSTAIQSVKDSSSPLELSVNSLDSTEHNHARTIPHSSPLHNSTPPPLGQGGSPQSQSSFSVLFHSPLGGGSPGGEGGTHSFMAPHDGDVSLCSDDLQNLFELARELFGVHSSSLIHNGEQDLEQRSWLRLIHCYLLPLISLHYEDLPAVKGAQGSHFQLLASLDQQILGNSSEIMKLKSELLSLREQLLPTVQSQAENGLCSHMFLRLFTTDLRQLEEEGRNKIQSALKNLELSQKLSMPMLEELDKRFKEEKKAGEALLIQTLELRCALERVVSLEDDSAPSEKEEGSLQWRYVEIHRELVLLRERSAALSNKKVLALSVREALEETLATLRSGNATTGMDVGLQGGHSTDVLSEASHYAATNEYLTLKDKVQKLLCLHSSPASKLHHSFYSLLRRDWFPTVTDDFVHISQPVSQQSFTHRTMTMPAKSARKSSSPQNVRRHWSLMKRPRNTSPSPPNLPYLASLVKSHFERIVDTLCQHFNDRDVNFCQQVWLCYERLFFEAFSSEFLPLYQAHYAKFCEQLQLNCVSVSVLDPRSLNLGAPDEALLRVFKSRSFEEASRLYQELTDEGYLAGTKTLEQDPEFRALFGGVTSDLTSLPLAISPLERLQLLTSAFRKVMATLSELKMRSLLEQRSFQEESVDLSHAGVSCDDLLPLLTLILLQLHPSFLANLHLHCCFLEDYIAQFLSAGWHGYSLAAFRSVLQIISEL